MHIQKHLLHTGVLVTILVAGFLAIDGKHILQIHTVVASSAAGGSQPGGGGSSTGGGISSAQATFFSTVGVSFPSLNSSVQVSSQPQNSSVQVSSQPPISSVPVSSQPTFSSVGVTSQAFTSTAVSSQFFTSTAQTSFGVSSAQTSFSRFSFSSFQMSSFELSQTSISQFSAPSSAFSFSFSRQSQVSFSQFSFSRQSFSIRSTGGTQGGDTGTNQGGGDFGGPVGFETGGGGFFGGFGTVPTARPGGGSRAVDSFMPTKETFKAAADECKDPENRLKRTCVPLIAPLGEEDRVMIKPGADTFIDYFNQAVALLLTVSVGFAVLWILIGSYFIMVSGSDGGKRSTGKTMIIWALIGLVLVNFAGFFLRTLNNIFFV